MEFPNWGGERVQALHAASDYLRTPMHYLTARKVDQW